MKKTFFGFIVLIASLTINANETFSGFTMPESVAEGRDGAIYVSEMGERDVDKDGKISKINKEGVITTVAEGLYDPKGIVFFNDKLYVTDRDVVLEVSMNGSWIIYAGTMAFPKTPVFLNDIDVSVNGDIYVTDTGDFESSGFVFLIKKTGDISVMFENNKNIKAPNGVLPITSDKLLLVNWTGELLEADLTNNEVKKIAEGFDGGDGLAYNNGTIYVSSWKRGIVYKFVNGESTVIAEGFKAAADIALSLDKKKLIVPDMMSGTVTLVDAQ